MFTLAPQKGRTGSDRGKNSTWLPVTHHARHFEEVSVQGNPIGRRVSDGISRSGSRRTLGSWFQAR